MPEHDDALIAEIERHLRRPVALDPALDARVMARVRRESASRPGRPGSVLAWLRRPRQLSLSPLGGLAIAAGVAVVAAGTALLARGPAGGEPPLVQFVLVAPEASSVALVGDFNDWQPAATPLRPASAGGGLWSVAVPLEPGRYEYAFLVDGTVWTPDPAAPTAPADDFGTPNSVVTVGNRRS